MKFLIILISLQSTFVFCQFFNLYDYSELDVFSGFSDIIIDNGNYKLVGGSGYNPDRSPLRIEDMDQNGSLNNLFIDDNDTTIQLTSENGIKLLENSDGNYVTFIIDYHYDNLYLKSYEISKTGTKLRDSIFLELIPGFRVFSINSVRNEEDSTFSILINSRNNDANNSNDQIAKLTLFKINENFEIIESSELASSTNNFVFRIRNLIKRNNGNLLFINNRWRLNSLISLSFYDFDLIEIDTEGNIVYSKNFNTSHICFAGNTILDLDTAIVFDLTNSFLDPNLGPESYFSSLSLVCYNQTTENFIWEKEIFPYLATRHFRKTYINDILLDNQNNLVYCFTSHRFNSSNNTEFASSFSIHNRKIDGELNWARNFNTSFFNLDFETRKIIQDLNGNYIGCGKSRNDENFYLNEPSDFAYAFKFNCFGYLDSPIVEISHRISNDTLIILNDSKYFDTLEINFGNDESVRISCEMDTIVYVYPKSGNYTVQVNTVVCDATLHQSKSFSLSVVKTNEPNDLPIQIYPNPIMEGTFYVENFLGHIEVYDLSGKFVFSEHVHAISEKFQISTKLPSGTYMFKFKSLNSELKNTIKRIVVIN